jgi:flagellar motor switch protein FliM
MTGPESAGGRGDADGLTQKDIDQLLQRAGAKVSGRKTPEATPYNFLRPPRISKDRRNQLESIFGRFALSMQSMLSSRLRMPMDVTCSVEQATFSEYVLAIANPCAAFVFDLGGPVDGQGVIDLSTDLGFFIIDRAFGGPGEATSAQRALTALERSVARGIIEKLLGLFREAWNEHLAFKPEIVGFESTPDMLKIASHEDNVLVVNLEVRGGQFSSLVAVCLPLLALESFLVEKTGRAPGRQALTPVQRQVVETAVREAQVDLVARFPLIKLTAREVATIKVGQIIQTAQPIDGPVELHINGSRRFVGQLGQYRRMLGLRITDAVTATSVPTTRASRGRLQ